MGDFKSQRNKFWQKTYFLSHKWKQKLLSRCQTKSGKKVYKVSVFLDKISLTNKQIHFQGFSLMISAWNLSFLVGTLCFLQRCQETNRQTNRFVCFFRANEPPNESQTNRKRTTLFHPSLVSLSWASLVNISWKLDPGEQVLHFYLFLDQTNRFVCSRPWMEICGNFSKLHHTVRKRDIWKIPKAFCPQIFSCNCQMCFTNKIWIFWPEKQKAKISKFQKWWKK